MSSRYTPPESPVGCYKLAVLIVVVIVAALIVTLLLERGF